MCREGQDSSACPKTALESVIENTIADAIQISAAVLCWADIISNDLLAF